VTSHPEYAITVLLRNVPSTFSQKYPNVKIVKGDYDSTEIITKAASEAHIVVHNGNSDHEASINALIAGLLVRDSTSFLLHLGGTGIVADHRSDSFRGELNPKVWSDINDIDAIWSLPDDALHRNVDKIIQTAAETHGEKLKTAIICPPDIYGPGKGLARTQSVYFPTFYAESVKLGQTFYANSGANSRSWVHLDDLMVVYLRLVEAAVNGGNGAEWGKQGYYFTSSQEATQFDIAVAAGKILKQHGILQNEEPRRCSIEEVYGMLSHYGSPGIGLYMYCANSRTRADRAKKLLGYEPKAASIWESMEADLLAYKNDQQAR
jgi:hypothetical protein